MAFDHERLTAGRVHTSDLDHYVRHCEEKFGGIHNPQWAEYVSDFELVFDTLVDIRLDPFSDTYLNQQLDLHREITGRLLDQDLNELVPINVEHNAAGTNPYNSNAVHVISGHAATVAIALRLAGLPDRPRVLDLGVGAGMSSELIAYCGAIVDAVDINPLSIDLINRRARAWKLPVTAYQGNFDTFQGEEGVYDAAFFFASLHHGVAAWNVLRRTAKWLRPDGAIVFSGEPIQRTWWPHWGLRLDPESAYVSRKYGWFESGWSEAFLHRMFRDIGFRLNLAPVLPAGVVEGSWVGVARQAQDLGRDVPLGPPTIETGVRIRFSNDGDGPAYLAHGWQSSEAWGTWSSGHESGLLLVLPPGQAWDVLLQVHILVSDTWPEQAVEIIADNEPVAVVLLGIQEGSATMQSSSSISIRLIGSVEGGPIVLKLRYPLATKPSLIGRGGDTRVLAIGLISLTASVSQY